MEINGCNIIIDYERNLAIIKSKICNKCRKDLTIELFYEKKTNYKDKYGLTRSYIYLQSECKKCHNERQKRYRNYETKQNKKTLKNKD